MLTLLQFGGIDDQTQSVVGGGVVQGVHRCQSPQRLLRLCIASLADEPPGRFWSEEDASDQRNGPDPLNRKGNPVRPLVRSIDHGPQHTGANELSDDPASMRRILSARKNAVQEENNVQIDICGQICPQSQGAHLGRICYRDSLKDAPAHRAQDLSKE